MPSSCYYQFVYNNFLQTLYGFFVHPKVSHAHWGYSGMYFFATAS